MLATNKEAKHKAIIINFGHLQLARLECDLSSSWPPLAAGTRTQINTVAGRALLKSNEAIFVSVDVAA